jgi:hypothetical protein
MQLAMTQANNDETEKRVTRIKEKDNIKKRTEKGQFASGHSGNPRGRPPRIPHIRAAAARYSVEAIDFLGQILRDTTASIQQRQQAATILLRIAGRFDDDDKNHENNTEPYNKYTSLEEYASRINAHYNAL